jgi:hypothetical protein
MTTNNTYFAQNLYGTKDGGNNLSHRELADVGTYLKYTKLACFSYVITAFSSWYSFNSITALLVWISFGLNQLLQWLQHFCNLNRVCETASCKFDKGKSQGDQKESAKSLLRNTTVFSLPRASQN